MAPDFTISARMNTSGKRSSYRIFAVRNVILALFPAAFTGG